MQVIQPANHKEIKKELNADKDDLQQALNTWQMKDKYAKTENTHRHLCKYR